MTDPSPGQLAELACILEVTARKPGNVHRGADFEDATFVEFLLSASALRGPMDRASAAGVGQAIAEAVEATRRVAATNTNLGMILLLAPLAAVPPTAPDLREGVRRVLAGLTVADARLAFGAIRRARPAGLGTAADQDVAGEPTVTLREAMRLASDRDLIARQYAGDFAEVFDLALPALGMAIAAGRPVETAIQGAFLAVLARRPDSLIARKRGEPEASRASALAREVLAAGWPDSPEGRAAFVSLDGWLRQKGHARNPGTTADLVAAALFAALRDGTIGLPIARFPAMTEASKRYRVRVAKDELVFSAGHFITFDGDRCEPIHGHNYRTAVEVEGDLDENQYVFDFIALRDLTRGVVSSWDHRMLLPSQSSLILLEEEGPNWRVRYRDRSWSFPRDECVVLPVANTTAERLADVIAVRLREAIGARGLAVPGVIRVEVEENVGQSAQVEWRGEPGR